LQCGFWFDIIGDLHRMSPAGLYVAGFYL